MTDSGQSLTATSTTMSATLAADAFLLLTLSNCSIVANAAHQLSGSLALECVTIQVSGAPTAGNGEDHHVYLVLRMNDTEIPIDPSRKIQTYFSESGSRKYTFLATDTDPVELVLTVALPSFPDAHFLEEIEIFESILAQYADLQDPLAQDAPTPDVLPNIYDTTDSKELRGHLVLVDQDNGEVVGEFDRKFSVQEDPTLSKKGHENDPVIIELPESNEEYDANAMEIFARAIPPEQRDWITKGATVISHAISGSTTLLLTAISAGSSYYTSRSKPSTPRTASTSSVSTPGSAAPPPLPPRAVAFLSSARTRKGLAAVHSVSGEAVKVSAKTVEIIDGMLKKALGSSKGKGRATLTPGSRSSRPPLPPRAPSPSPYLAPPPPYSTSSDMVPLTSEKPPLPPRRQPSPSPSPSRGSSPTPPTLPPRKSGEVISLKLSTTARILLSADLILSTIDNSTRRLLESGSENLGTVVGHKYGPEAGESSVLIAGTARNVALVYIDLRGIGRKALLRRAGKEFVKGRVTDIVHKKD
ncbi:hypothetical protein C8F04DRAFT_1073345 [Mycena alexandri]|uniref:Senescence domain-containing protein n=1 Tax=Mycena alexandri TaxID=1745969 RepID=A0AAD6TBC6_9AGAR|nr:hypothetical protein C8F04DRAFT_1073345 [Mycena alexandri]